MANNFLKIKNGVYFPGLTSDPSGARAGDFYYNSTSNQFRFYDGSSWNAVGSGSSVPYDPGIKTATYTLSAVNNGGIIRINTYSSSAFNLQLFTPAAAGFTCTIKDVGGNLNTTAVTLVRSASEFIEGVGANYTLDADYGMWKIYWDGANWWFI